MKIFEDFFLPNDSFIPELDQHLQHTDTDLFRIVVHTGADGAEAVWCQYSAIQLIGLVLLILLIFFIRPSSSLLWMTVSKRMSPNQLNC